MDLAKQPLAYGDAALAALEIDLKQALRAVEQPLLLLANEQDPRDGGLAKLARLARSARVAPRPDTPAELADRVRAHWSR